MARDSRSSSGNPYCAQQNRSWDERPNAERCTCCSVLPNAFWNCCLKWIAVRKSSWDCQRSVLWRKWPHWQLMCPNTMRYAKKTNCNGTVCLSAFRYGNADVHLHLCVQHRFERTQVHEFLFITQRHVCFETSCVILIRWDTPVDTPRHAAKLFILFLSMHLHQCTLLGVSKLQKVLMQGNLTLRLLVVN